MIRLGNGVLSAARFAAGAGSLAAAALTVRRWCFGTAVLDAVYYEVYPVRDPVAVWPFAAAALAAAPVVWKKFPQMRRPQLLLAGGLLWILLALPATFPNLAAVLAVTAWCMERCLGDKWHLPQLPPLPARLLVVLMAAAAAAWSYCQQTCAYASLFLAYQDWGEYAECYLRLVSGALSARAYLVQAGHFNPLPNVLMTAVLRAWRAPEAVFLTSALLSGSLPLLAWQLGRAYRLPRSAALACAAAAVLNPVLLNQSLSLFYGFHPVLFQGPVILAFFICERRNCRSGMAAAVLLSLLIQETAAVLWFGYALYLFCRRKFIAGALLGVFCVAVFMTVSKTVIPFASEATTNPQLFHYARLGNSLSEIVLSPLLRPRAVLETLAQRQNLYFTVALLLPFGALALRAPQRLLTALPLLAGVLMQSSPDIKNPVMQYGFEISVIVLAASAAAAGGLLRRRNASAKRAFRSGIRTMILMTVLCAAAWGRLPGEPYQARPVFGRPDAAKVIAALRRFADGGGRILATKRLRLYFMFHGKAAAPDVAMFPGDTVILDLDDTMDSAGAFRRGLIADPRAMPVFSTNFCGRQFAVWKIAPPGTPRPKLPFMHLLDDKVFAAAGSLLPQNDAAFEARLARTQRGPVLLLRVCRKVDCDVRIDLKMRQAGRVTHRTFRFGEGVYPAWCAKPGETYAAALSGSFPEEVRLRLIRGE